VVNFELPNVPEDYVHRIGRTGRAGNEGEAMSLVCVDEHKLLRDIERLIKRELPKVVVPGYEPDPSIKPEPIQKPRGARGGQRPAGAGRGGNAKPRGNGGQPKGNGNRVRNDGGQGQRRSGSGKPRNRNRATV
jgi:ATP-dependent RNA helicase RhlE